MSGKVGRKRKDEQLSEIGVGELGADSGAAAAAAAAPSGKRPQKTASSSQLLVGPVSSDVVKRYVSMLKNLETHNVPSITRVVDNCYAMPGCRMTNSSMEVLVASQVHIYIAPIRFTDGDLCILTCDACCDSQRITMRHVDGKTIPMHDWIEESAPFAESKECIHVKAFKICDALNNHVPDKEDFVYSAFGAPPMQFDPSVIVVSERPFVASLSLESEKEMYSRVFVTLEGIAGHWGDDGLPKKYIKCLHCKKPRNYTCDHVKSFFNWANDSNMNEHLNGACINEPNAARVRRIETVCASSISTEKIMLDSVSPFTSIRVHGGDWLPLHDKCVPPIAGKCKCELDWDSRDPVAEKWLSRSKNRKERSILYGPGACREVTVYYRPCTNPDPKKRCKRLYDGIEDGIFNLSGDSLFLHETLFSYVDAMTHSKMTAYGMHQKILEAYVRSGDNFCSCGVFHRAIQLFIQLLDVDYDKGFYCPYCSKLHPKDMTVIVDGKAKGHKRSLASSIHPDVPYSASDAVVHCKRPVEYAYIRNEKARSLLWSYAKGTEELPINLMTKFQLPAGLAKMLLFITDNNKVKIEGKRLCPPVYRDLIACISTPHPVVTIIPSELVYGVGADPSVFDELISGDKISPDIVSKVVAWWPVLGAVMAPSGNQIWETVPVEFCDFLKELQECARLPGEVNHGDVPPASNPDGLPDDLLAFFSGNMKKRRRRIRNYSVDAKANAARVQASEYGPCTKHLKPGAHKFTPGLFTVVCPHGIILGFQALRRFEGPSTLFTILYERFQFAPGTVVYDNACNAGRYCLSREPKFFSLTKWLIDRLHFKNHVGCHSCFNIDMYPSDTKILKGKMTLGELNTQAVEQVNSKLSYMGGVSFMKESSYIQYVKLFMYLLNRQKIAKVVV